MLLGAVIGNVAILAVFWHSFCSLVTLEKLCPICTTISALHLPEDLNRGGDLPQPRYTVIARGPELCSLNSTSKGCHSAHVVRQLLFFFVYIFRKKLLKRHCFLTVCLFL